MIQIGSVNKLIIDHLSKIGPYLADPTEKAGDRETVLLPGKEMPEHAKAGDPLEVFIYRDSSDRPIATLRRPLIQMDEFVPLKVVDITRIGAFLDWGLEKDLLLPYSEQTVRVQIGRKYMVSLYVDKSGRLCATMKIYPKLTCATPYQTGDWVEGYVYQINPEMGAFVAVDCKYHGLIPRREIAAADVHCGDFVKARVTEVRRDGKLALSPNRKAYKEIPADSKRVYDRLVKAGGFLPYNDKTPPAVIAKEFGMSKASFKRAAGHLLKIHRIRLDSKGMTLTARK